MTKSKSIFTLSLLLLATAAFAPSAQAATQEVAGVVWTYTVVSNAVVIGDFPNTNYTSAISRDTSGEIVIPDTLGGLPVVDIAPYAFSCCTNITAVTIPDAVTNIGISAFSCASDKILTGYKVINVTDGGTTTQTLTPTYRCIEGLSTSHMNLAKLTLPKSLKIIGAEAFAECANLSSITFRGSVEIIGSGAFSSCRKLKTLVLPNGLRTLGSTRTLIGYTTTTTTEGGTTTQIVTPNYEYDGSGYSDKGVFEGCVSLSSVSIPSSVATIRNYAFKSCVSLMALNFSGAKPSVDGTSVLVGTPSDMTVNVKGDASGWIDPITCGRLAVWQHRLVTYDGVFPKAVDELDDDAAIDLVQNALSVIQAPGTVLSDEDKHEYLQAIQGIVDRHPAILSCAASALESMGDCLSDTEKEEFAKWALTVASTRLNPSVGSSSSHSGSSATEAKLTVTNVVLHYVVNSITPDLAVPITTDTGIVNVMTEVMGGNIAIPDYWATNYPAFRTVFGSDFAASLMKPTGKLDAGGKPMLVWQDFVAGTDPTDEDDVFRASVTMVDGKPVVSYTPELNETEKAKRKYTTWGKTRLQDVDWIEVSNGREADYNFFRVTVEMR